MTQLLLWVGYITALVAVAHIAGDDLDMSRWNPRSHWVVAGLLLGVGGLTWGRHWVEQEREKILECIHAQYTPLQAGVPSDATNAREATYAMVRYCAYE